MSGRGTKLTSHKLRIRWITEKASFLNVTTKCCSQIHECNECYPSPKRVKKLSFHFVVSMFRSCTKYYWNIGYAINQLLMHFISSGYLDSVYLYHLEWKTNMFVGLFVCFFFSIFIKWELIDCTHYTSEIDIEMEWNWLNAERRLLSSEPLNAHQFYFE